MDDQLDRWISDLDRASLPQGVELQFLPYGEIAFHRLLESLRTKELSSDQVTNILHVMFAVARETSHACLNDLATIALELFGHSDAHVRDCAIMYATLIGRIAKAFPHFTLPVAQPRVLVPQLERAINTGISPRNMTLIQAYFADEPGHPNL